MRRIDKRRNHQVTSASLNLNENKVIQISPFRYLMRGNSKARADPECMFTPTNPTDKRQISVRRKRGFSR
ncbi:hypothetical protein G4O51_09620 [Candidatus Bathyarchaeota archaeon A05DMB-2]|jgi:hypothetical protein|nr:hypothetical protein [Candidatus Bathyarchaeota archaeon A05DMB-2]